MSTDTPSPPEEYSRPPHPQPATSQNVSSSMQHQWNSGGIGGKEGSIPTSLADEDEAFLNSSSSSSTRKNNDVNAEEVGNISSTSEKMAFLLEKQKQLASIPTKKR